MCFICVLCIILDILSFTLRRMHLVSRHLHCFVVAMENCHQYVQLSQAHIILAGPNDTLFIVEFSLSSALWVHFLFVLSAFSRFDTFSRRLPPMEPFMCARLIAFRPYRKAGIWPVVVLNNLHGTLTPNHQHKFICSFNKERA